MKYTIESSETVYSGFFTLEKFNLRHELFKGGWSNTIVRERLHRGHAAAVLPYDPEHDQVLFIEQFRIGGTIEPDAAWQREIIAGYIEQDETPESVVQREAKEEAGIQLEKLIPVQQYYSVPGNCTEKIYLYVGLCNLQGAGGIFGLEEEGEDIKAEVVSYDQAVEYLNTGGLHSAIPIIAMQWLMMNREKIRS